MRSQTLSFRPRTKADDAFIVGLGREVFSRWSREPGRSVLSMAAVAGTRTEIATAGGRPVGFVVVSFERLGRRFGPWTDPTIARLDAIAVSPAAQRRGVGAALLERAEAIASHEGGVVMMLMTAQRNLAARRLFRDAGFFALLQLPREYANGDAAVEMFKAIALG